MTYAPLVGIFTPASLAGLTEHGDNFFIPAPSIFVQALAGADTKRLTGFVFDITETQTYVPISEPGSLALFAVAALACCYFRAPGYWCEPCVER